MTMPMMMLLLLFNLFSCGGDSGNSDAFERQEEVPEPELVQKIFRTDLRAVNPTVDSDLEGQAIIRLEDESFEVTIGMQKVPAPVHRQHVRMGKTCPTPSDDTNQDGVIDLIEAEAISGGVYIPLDDDLDQVVADSRRYPNGGFLNAYGYQEDTTRKQVVTELGAEDDLMLGDRVVMVLGTDEDQELPPTVASPDDTIPQETVPIACGELTQIAGPSL